MIAAVARISAASTPSARTRWLTTSRTLGGRSRTSPGAESGIDERTGLGEVAHDLDDEERVAVGLVADRPRELRDVVLFGECGDELADLALAESRECQPFEPLQPSQIGERLGEGGGPQQVRVAVSSDDQDPLRARDDEEVAQQQQGRFVRPMQVVEHDDGAARSGRVRDQPGDSLEEPVALRVGVGVRPVRHGRDEIGQEPSE